MRAGLASDPSTLLMGDCDMEWLKRLLKRKKRKKLELVHYTLADDYLAEGWRIARKEEDRNQEYGWVYLELVE